MRLESAASPGVLLTGATGFLGGEVLVRLLERDERQLYVLARASDDEEAAARVDGVLRNLLGDAGRFAGRVEAVAADLQRPGLGIDGPRRDELAERIGLIVHCAASVSFTLGLEESREVNVEGTRRMLDFAELCTARGGLDCFTHVSTAYVAGTFAGRFGERQLDVGQGFRNGYERSKFEAEGLVRERAGKVPVQVLRPSIVMGDSRTGWTNSFNVLYWPLRAFTKRALPAIPARRSSPVDVVPVDYVADGIAELAGRPGTTYHLTASERAASVAEIIELGTSYLDRRAPIVLPPGLYRRALHPLLVRTGPEKRRRALRKTESLFPYFSMSVRYDRELPIAPPPLSSYFDRLMDFALEADWGRRPIGRHELTERAVKPLARV